MARTARARARWIVRLDAVLRHDAGGRRASAGRLARPGASCGLQGVVNGPRPTRRRACLLTCLPFLAACAVQAAMPPGGHRIQTPAEARQEEGERRRVRLIA